MPCLTMSFSWMTPRTSAPSATTSGVDPARAMPLDDRVELGGIAPPCSVTQRCTASAAPLRICRPSTSRPDIRVRAVKGTNVWSAPRSRSRMPKRSLASTTIVRPSGVSSASEPAGPRPPAPRSVMAADGQELRRLAVAEGDRARLVEQERLDVAGRLDGAAAHGEHVALHEPVHAGDADGREQPADRRRDEADEQRDEHDDRDGRCRRSGRTAAA